MNNLRIVAKCIIKTGVTRGTNTAISISEMFYNYIPGALAKGRKK